MRPLAIYVGVGIPVLLAANYHYLEEEWKFFFYLILGANLFMALLAFLRVSRRRVVDNTGSRFTSLSGLLLAILTLATILHEVNETVNFGLQLKTLLGAVIWMLPAFALPALMKTEQDFVSVARWVERGLIWISGSVLLAAFLSTLGVQFGEILMYRGAGVRTFGPLGDQVGFISALGLLLALTRGSIFFVLFHSSAIILTGTRGALLVLVCSGLTVLGVVIAGRRKGRLRLALSCLLGLGAIVGVLNTSIGETVWSRIADRDVLDATMQTRLTSMEIGADIFRESPWLGVGYAGFNREAILRGAHLYFQKFNDVYISNSNNQFIEMAVSGGGIGFVVYVALLVSALRVQFRASGKTAGALSYFFRGSALWFSGMVLGNQAATWIQVNSLAAVYFFLLPALAYRCCRVIAESSAPKSQVDYQHQFTANHPSVALAER